MDDALQPDELPVLPGADERPPRDLEHLRALAASLDCVLPEDLCALGAIKHSTAEAWAKRGEGPAYVMFGNRRLYPREPLREFLQGRVRSRAASARGLL
jgi:hypothetical protein